MSSPNPSTVTLPLDEWCAEQSLRDSNVELLGVFHYREMAAGRGWDTRGNYAERYLQAATKPTD
jgi:hypothetical protein